MTFTEWWSARQRANDYLSELDSDAAEAAWNAAIRAAAAAVQKVNDDALYHIPSGSEYHSAVIDLFAIDSTPR